MYLTYYLERRWNKLESSLRCQLEENLAYQNNRVKVTYVCQVYTSQKRTNFF